MFDYRIRFAKRNNLKYLSHLDLMKTFERGMRRAQLPLAFSGGFHPHPKISFGPALAVGISSSDEYLDIELLAEINNEQLLKSLNRVLPDDLSILAVKRIEGRVKPLDAIINRASYLILARIEPDQKAELIQQLTGLLAAPELPTIRVNRDGQKIVNIRPWLHNLTVEEKSGNAIQIFLAGEIGSGGNLRPEDILNNLKLPIKVMEIVRTGLWHEEKGLVKKPLDFCEKTGDVNHG
jgi:radical SAM-linked protein